MKVVASLAMSLGLFCQAQALTVATSFSIGQDMVKNVAGEHAKIINLVGADADIHHYEFTPRDVKMLADKNGVDIFFMHGLGLDPWAEPLMKAAHFKGKVVVLSEGVTPRRFETNALGEDGHDHDHEHDEGHDHHHHHDHEEHDHHAHEHHHHHHHGDMDPHAWQSLRNAQIYVDNIANALSDMDKANASIYQANAKAYKEKLATLDQEFKAKFSTISPERRVLVTSHDALSYFADEYGLQVLTPLGFSSDAEPSAKEVALMVKEIRERGISTLFLENITDPKLLEQIARESKAKIGGVLYTDALARSGKASTYLGMMQSNAETVFEALKD